MFAKATALFPSMLLLGLGMLGDMHLWGEADPLSGGAGWVGAGLLGLVLSWLLLKHLPDKDRQLEKLLTLKDTQITNAIQSHQSIQENAVNKFTENLSNALRTFSDCLREERTTYQKWHDENLGQLAAIRLDGKELRHHVMNLAHELGLRSVVERKASEEHKAREGHERGKP